MSLLFLAAADQFGRVDEGAFDRVLKLGLIRSLKVELQEFSRHLSENSLLQLFLIKWLVHVWSTPLDLSLGEFQKQMVL